MRRHSSIQAKPRDQNNMPAAHRHSGSFGPSTEVPVPSSPGLFGNGRERNGPSNFDLARSPPQNGSSKNTKHVPCKFFRQGACQAGNACPFSHSLDPMMQQAPCKYFMKGNCKFGAKCALAHYLPNGHRVSRADLDAGLAISNRGSFGMNTRTDPTAFPQPEGAFNNQFVQQPFTNQDQFTAQDQFIFPEDEFDAYDTSRYKDNNHAIPFDNLNSPPTSQFGSPPNENTFPRHAADNIRSALNAPLPASFDANSTPYYIKFGHSGQSVPDKFGMRSPPTSALSKRLGSPPDSLSGIKSNVGSALRNVSSPLSMSPQTGDESIGGRLMHSQKTTRPRMISASVPRNSLHDWDESGGPETELLPNSLHDEVYLPGERMRRMSRPDDLSNSAKEISEGLNIPRRGSATVGSPPMGSSPSRFRGLFEEQRRKEETSVQPSQNFGHVGSPLRESWMPHETSDSSRPRQISGITQAMARMELKGVETNEANGSTRPIVGFRTASNFSRSDRQISSPGLSGGRIDEEGEGGFFEMDDESSKRSSSNWTLPQPHGQNGAQKVEQSARSQEANGAINIDNGVRTVFGFRA